jgi:dipeptidyl-peptidase-4
VGRDGERVVYLLGDHLRVFDVATGRTRTVATGAAEYACDPQATVAAYAAHGRISRVRLRGEPEPEDPGVRGAEPRPDPTGRHLAYRMGRALYVLAEGESRPALLAGEASPAVHWGGVDMDAAGFGRHRGWWWAPDGSAILATRFDGPHSTSLHLLELDGGWVDVHWDRWVYPYVATVSWHDGPPLITVLRRSQSHGLVLTVDPRTGETQVHAELSDPRFVRTVDGTPCHLADGRVLVGSEIAHESYDSRCLFADGTLLTPPHLYVRRVAGRLAPFCWGPDRLGSPRSYAPAARDPAARNPAQQDRAHWGGLDPEIGDLLVEASTDPAEQHLYRVRGAIGRGGAMTAERLTREPGWHTGRCGGQTLVIGSAGFDHAGTRWTVLHRGIPVGHLADDQERDSVAGPAVAPSSHRPVLDRVTDRRLPVGVLYPPRHLLGRRLPVLVDLPPALGGQTVLARADIWARRQWWAEAGFAVVAVDTRGSTGIGPGFEKVVHRRLVDVLVTDLAEAVRELGAKDPDLDLSHVLLRGARIGGWAAACAVRDRPETFRGGVVRAPLRDWTQAPAVLSERYLGNLVDNAEVWAHHVLAVLPEGVREIPADAPAETELAVLRAILA